MLKKRKRWTPKKQLNSVDLVDREKKKWQLNFRRYVIEKLPCIKYAPFFGLDIENLRKWISYYFDEDMNWGNFGTVWKFTHFLPISFFDFSKEEDLKLCWNFFNMKAEKINNESSKDIEILNVSNYFKELYFLTKQPILLNYIEKINSYLQKKITIQQNFIDFLNYNKVLLNDLKDFNEVDYYKLNSLQISLDNLLIEKELEKKFL